MKLIFIKIPLLLMLVCSTVFAQVGIGTIEPDASAALDIEATDKGLLPPRMTGDDRDQINSPAQGLMIYCTNCGSDGEMQVYNGAAWVNLMGGDAAAAPTQIGDFRDGGVVFYVAPTPTDLNGDGNLNIGIVAAVSDQSSGTQWGCAGNHFSTLTDIGQGAQNTNAIDAGCATSGIATDICANLDLNGYTDWFLPSIDELNLMYQNKEDIGGFASALYWSSSETINGNGAWTQYFDGGQVTKSKISTYKVRAVRAF